MSVIKQVRVGQTVWVAELQQRFDDAQDPEDKADSYTAVFELVVDSVRNKRGAQLFNAVAKTDARAFVMEDGAGFTVHSTKADAHEAAKSHYKRWIGVDPVTVREI